MRFLVTVSTSGCVTYEVEAPSREELDQALSTGGFFDLNPEVWDSQTDEEDFSNPEIEQRSISRKVDETGTGEDT